MAIHDVLYHYCPPEAFFAILKSKSLWLTHLSYFEDQEEHRWFRKIVRKVMLSRDPYGTNSAYAYLRKQMDEHDFTGIFCACFSTEGDMLTQWKAYADDGRGFAIGFSRKCLEAISKRNEHEAMELAEVEYYEDRHCEYAREFLDQVDRLDKQLGPRGRSELGRWFVNDNVWRHAAKCKKPHFRVEQEVRMIDFEGGDAEFRLRGNQIVPYRQVSFAPPTAEGTDSAEGWHPISEIVAGPRVTCREANEDALRHMLEQLGYQSMPVFKGSDLRLL